MTMEDRVESTKDKLKGKGNQIAGEIRGDEDQKLRGHGQELKGHLKDAKADVKESLR